MPSENFDLFFQSIGHARLISAGCGQFNKQAISLFVAQPDVLLTGNDVQIKAIIHVSKYPRRVFSRYISCAQFQLEIFRTAHPFPSTRLDTELSRCIPRRPRLILLHLDLYVFEWRV